MISDANFQDGRVEASKTHTSLLASAGFALLLFLGALTLFASNLLLWVDSSLLNSGEFSDAVNDALDKPEVERRIAEVLAREVVEDGQIQARIREELPPQLDFAGRVADAQIETVITEVAVRVLDTDFAGTVRREIIEDLHRAVIRILEDNDTVVGVQGNELVLDLREVVVRLFDRIGIAPPERVENQDLGRVVLVEDASGLREASFFVENHTAIATACLLGAIAAFVLAALVAPSRRRGALYSGYAIAGVGLATLLLIWLGNQALASTAEERVVVREILNSLLSNLRPQSLALVLLGACVIAVADERILTGLRKAYSAGATLIEKHASPTTVLVAIGGAALILVLI